MIRYVGEDSSFGIEYIEPTIEDCRKEVKLSFLTSVREVSFSIYWMINPLMMSSQLFLLNQSLIKFNNVVISSGSDHLAMLWNSIFDLILLYDTIFLINVTFFLQHFFARNICYLFTIDGNSNASDGHARKNGGTRSQ